LHTRNGPKEKRAAYREDLGTSSNRKKNRGVKIVEERFAEVYEWNLNGPRQDVRQK